MHIEHIAIWTKDIEAMKQIYIKYFNANANSKYINPNKKFDSYFLSFDSGARIEIMNKPEILNTKNYSNEQFCGLIHFAFSIGTRERVDSLTTQQNNDGYEILDSPRETGDGYYESVVLDPENNWIEITI